MNLDKSPLASKTIWVNVVTVLIGAITVLTGSDWIKDHPTLAATLLALLGVLNVFLRLITTTAIRFLWLGLLLLIPAAAQAQYETSDAGHPANKTIDGQYYVLWDGVWHREVMQPDGFGNLYPLSAAESQWVQEYG